MNNGIELEDVTFHMNGEPIKTINATMAKIECSSSESKVLEDGSSFRFTNRSYSGTLNNVQISGEFKGMILDSTQRFTVIAENYNLPRGNQLPKKKRIRNKWMKKYYREIEMENVYLS